jgi:iron complex transport system permease protein
VKRWFFVGIVFLLLSLLFSFVIGGTDLRFSEIVDGLFRREKRAAIIVWHIRLPRTILSLLVGAGLASAGVVLQGILRNPLAEPYTLGMSAGAAFGIACGVAFGIPVPLWLFALSGSILSVLFVYLVASQHQFSSTSLILSGVVMSFLFSSAVLFIFSLAKPEEVHKVFLWLAGDLSSGTDRLLLVSPLIVCCILLSVAFGRDLDALSLGKEKAESLGINTESIRRFLFLTSSIMTASCVLVSGIIGFVGLIIPHIVRKIVCFNHRSLILLSAIFGASFILLSDTLARCLLSPIELPVGVVTGIVGGAFFLYLLFRLRRWEF